MKHTTYLDLLVSLLVIVFCAIDTLATSIYWQHQAVVHRGARWEADSWGFTSFHWNDDSAQAPFIDPVADSLIPPPLKKK